MTGHGVQVEALEHVVQIQEQQLLGMSSLGQAERPEVAAMLPRWRHETLRQYELRLRAQLSAKNAEVAFKNARGDLEERVQRAGASQTVCCLCRENVARFSVLFSRVLQRDMHDSG